MGTTGCLGALTPFVLRGRVDKVVYALLEATVGIALLVEINDSQSSSQNHLNEKNSGESQSSQIQPSENQSSQIQLSENKLSETQSSQIQPIESQSSLIQPSETQSSQIQLSETKSSQIQLSETQSSQNPSNELHSSEKRVSSGDIGNKVVELGCQRSSKEKTVTWTLCSRGQPQQHTFAIASRIAGVNSLTRLGRIVLCEP